MSAICNRNHRYSQEFELLPESQKLSEGRHHCAGCAYQQGFEHGFEGIEPGFSPDNIDWSQAGTVRHKSASAAYHVGYADGLRSR